jgi:hypothetical protein
MFYFFKKITYSKSHLLVVIFSDLGESSQAPAASAERNPANG